MPTLRLMAVLAHPDDESLGVGGTLAKYAGEGVETVLVTATLGQRGRYRGHPPGHELHPGPAALAGIREAELRAAAGVLGVRELILLGYPDQELDRADPHEAVSRIAQAIRRARPHVVLTFGPDGAYGHPDHVAISQLTTAAIVAAADASFTTGESLAVAPHAVSKLSLSGNAGARVGCLPDGLQAARLGGGWRGAPPCCLASMGGHNGHRYASRLGGRMARGVVPRVADCGLCAAQGAVT